VLALEAFRKYSLEPDRLSEVKHESSDEHDRLHARYGFNDVLGGYQVDNTSRFSVTL
jgi:hypothetical protein